MDRRQRRTSSSPDLAPDHHRRGDIQGLRALAVVLVVVFHTGLALPGGFIGVDVFFVISGYVITQLLLREQRAHGRIALGRFALRRMRRLLPALSVMLAVVAVLVPFVAPIASRAITLRTGAGASVFAANLVLARASADYFSPAADTNAFLHTWSLSIEEQFYFVLPALLVGGIALGGRRHRGRAGHAAGAVLGLIGVVSFGLSWIFTTGRGPAVLANASETIAFYAPFTRAWEFVAGGLLAVTATRLAPRRRAGATAVALGGLALLTWAAFVFGPTTPFPGLAALVPVAGTMALLAAGERRSRPGATSAAKAETEDQGSSTNVISGALARRAVQALGDRSYSWYLWHWPIIVFARSLLPGSDVAIVGAVVLSLVPAWLSYRFVENPMRLTPSPRARRTLALAGVCIVVPLVVIGVDVARPRTAAEVAYDQAFALHPDLVRGCDQDAPVHARDRAQCTWPASAARGTAVLVGDSNAGHFTGPFVTAVNAAGYDALVSTDSACPFVDLVIPVVSDANCIDVVRQSVSDLLQQHPSLVVIASASDEFIQDDAQFVPPGGDPVTGTGPKAAAWAAALHRVIAPLDAAGIPVVVVHPVPRLVAWTLGDCAGLRWMLDAPSCGASKPRDRALEFQRPARVAESEALVATGATAVDPFDALCPSDPCSAWDGSTWWWRDGTHISVEGSARVVDVLRVAVDRAQPR